MSVSHTPAITRMHQSKSIVESEPVIEPCQLGTTEGSQTTLCVTNPVGQRLEGFI